MLTPLAQAFPFGKRVLYESPCVAALTVARDGSLIRGYGIGADSATVKLSALKDIAERINVRVQGETESMESMTNGKVDRQFSTTTRLVTELQVEDAVQICIDNKDPAGLWHAVFELDTRPPVFRLGQRLGAALRSPGQIVFTGNTHLVRSGLARELASSVTIGHASAGEEVSLPLRLRRQHGGWYLMAGTEQVRLRDEDLFKALEFPHSPEVLLTLLNNNAQDRPASQLVEGDRFSLRIDAGRTGYLSLFNIYADGRVSLLAANETLRSPSPSVFPEAGHTFEAGLLAPGVPTRDIYLAAVSEAPLDRMTMHRLRVEQGQVSGEDSYQLEELLALLDQSAAVTASIMVTTLPQ